MQKQKPAITPRWLDQLFRLYWPLRQTIRPLSPATVPGHGAVVNENEDVVFRVWAPHAEKVFVTGSFNGWSRWRTPLANEGNGFWSATVGKAGPGDEYKYIIHRNSHQFERTDPYARDVTPPYLNAVVELATRTNGQRPFTPPALHELVIYELHVGTFAESADGPPGNFYGVIDKLPYLQSLGINAIEIMPIKAFPGEFSWGYNPSFPFAISRVYGGREGFRRLVEAAHAHGIAVIVDVVYNHFGPDQLSLWQFDGWSENGKGGIYFYNDWRSKTPWADTRPDYGRSEVRRFIRDNVMMWYEELGVDGLRWDATSFIRNAHGHDGDPGADIPEGWQMMAGINGEVRDRFPHSINIAEDLQGNSWLTKNQKDGGAGFDSQWDTNFVHPVRQALIVPDDAERDMGAVSQALTFTYNDAPFQRVVYTESHDEVANGKARVPYEINGQEPASWFSRKRSALGAVLMFTAPGVPMIFQGQEFLEDGWFDDQRALDWSKTAVNAGTLALYRALIRLRRNLDGYTHGLQGRSIRILRADDEKKLLAYHRWSYGGPGDDVIVVANFSVNPLKKVSIGVPHAGKWLVRLQSDEARFGQDFAKTAVAASYSAKAEPHDDLPYAITVPVPAYSALILSQEAAGTRAKTSRR